MKVAVFSHHRSGTHFLMQSIADNFPFTCKPNWHLDYPIGIDIWATPVLAKYLNRHKGKNRKRILKSHYAVEFFDGLLEEFTREFHLFYILRHPEDVMASYYQFSKKLRWLEAPDCDSLSDFIRAEPAGSCLRWQRRQHGSMIERWADHTQGWISASKSYPIHIIRYDDLKNNFDSTIRNIGDILGLSAELPKKPELTGIRPWKGGEHRELYTETDRAFIQSHVDSSILDLWDHR